MFAFDLLIFRTFSPWTENHNVSVPADAVGLILSGGLLFLVLLLTLGFLRWRWCEENAADAEVAKE